MQKILIMLGLIVLVAGLLWPWLSKLPIGRLPGDMAIKGENSSFYFPVTTMIIVSIVLTLIINWFKR